MEVEMKIRGLMMDPVNNMPIVILRDSAGSRILPIWVGVYEANAIALEIEKVATQRPMTHDLIKTLLLGMDAGVRKVVVSELKDDVFYAVIWVERDGKLTSIDSRPSDALAIALRLDTRETVPDPDAGLLVYLAQCERAPLAKVSANFIRENGEPKIVQLRFEK